MTPKSPSSSDGAPLPPRHRPALGSLANDTTESDLWDLGDDSDDAAAPVRLSLSASEAAPVEERPRSVSRDIPSPRKRAETQSDDQEAEPKPKTPPGDSIRMNVSNPRAKAQRSVTASGISKTESDFDELENWDDVPDIGELAQVEVVATAAPAPAPVTPVVETMPEAAPAAKPAAKKTENDSGDAKPQPDDEFSPVVPKNAKPISLKPNLKLSGTERIGLVSLVGMLVAFAVAILVYSLHHLPTETVKTQEKDFPIKGARLTIDSATSYWREPVMEGPEPDTFRRGSRLLPVLEMKVSGGPAAIRILFRDDERNVVGDAVTRSITAGGLMKVPATAGFDDVGMHAAYRTGGSKPWTVEVYEAPAETAVGKDFTKVFEMNISAARR